MLAYFFLGSFAFSSAALRSLSLSTAPIPFLATGLNGASGALRSPVLDYCGGGIGVFIFRLFAAALAILPAVVSGFAGADGRFLGSPVSFSGRWFTRVCLTVLGDRAALSVLNLVSAGRSAMMVHSAVWKGLGPGSIERDGAMVDAKGVGDDSGGWLLSRGQ